MCRDMCTQRTNRRIFRVGGQVRRTVPVPGCRCADDPGRLGDRSSAAASTSSGAHTITMPMPMLSVRYSSSVDIGGASSRTSRNSGGTGHEPSWITASTPSGSTRGRFSGSPPPVMWASALTCPPSSAGSQHVEVRAVRLEQRLAERAVEAVRHDVHRDPVEDLAQQRVAVGVRAAGRRRRSARRRRRRRRGAAVSARSTTPDERAGDVERARLVHAGHLGGLAAEQRAARRPRTPRPSR